MLRGRWVLTLLSFALLVYVSMRLGRVWSWWRSPPARWAGVELCPLCYGSDACQLVSEDLDLLCGGSVSSAAAFLGDKNVLFGCSRTRGRVVVKRLGHDWELNALRQRACAPFDGCEVANVDNVTEVLLPKIVERFDIRTADRAGFGSVVCPNSADALEIVGPFLRDTKGALSGIAALNAWTVANVNSEPLFLKYIESTVNGWPVPQYLGSCGLVTLQTFAGERLTEVLNESPMSKIKIAINLLDAADKLTFEHPKFRFYLTDVSTDNIVIKSKTTWETVFVDLENIIIVNKLADGKNLPESWSDNHTSKAFECHDCFMFSVHDVCEHHLSDHNQHAICKLLVEDIFDFMLISKRLSDLLVECYSPSSGNDRFKASKLLKDELNQLLLLNID